VTFAAAALSLLALADAPRFTASAIPMPEGSAGHWLADLDGDRRLDLLTGAAKRGAGRELRVHLQRSGGDFRSEPDRRIVLKADIVAFSVAEVRAEAGEEILFLTGSSCFSYSTALEGFAGNARKLFAWDLLLDLPDPDELIHLEAPAASKGGGPPLLVLPGAGGHGVFGLSGPGGEAGMHLLARLPEEPEGRRSRRESSRKIELNLGGLKDESFEGLVVTAAGRGGEGGGDFLKVESWLPAVVAADADGDGRLDLLRLARDPSGRLLKIHLQDAAGRFPESASWSGPIAGDGELRAVDFDGDGRADLLDEAAEGFGDSVFRFYKNRGGRFEGASADQVMKFSGFDVRAELADLDGDGRPELAVSAHEIPASSALSGGRVVRSLFVYRADPERVFSSRPAFKHEENFDAKGLKGIGQRIRLGADLQARGLRDALLVDRDGSLEAKHFRKDLSLESEPFYRFTPERMILRFRALDLNGDGRSDLVLSHSRSLTILVSRP
jgi:hypothetical protein